MGMFFAKPLRKESMDVIIFKVGLDALVTFLKTHFENMVKISRYIEWTTEHRSGAARCLEEFNP